MSVINIMVRRKTAANPMARIVCGNSDYKISFNFDEEWAAHGVKTARFIWNGQYADVVFTGNVCDVPVITNTTMVAVGVYAGDLRTTTPALIRCDKSILCGDGLPVEPRPDVYAQIIELLNEAGVGVEVDSTLSIKGAAADAKVVGDKIIQLSEEIANQSGGGGAGKINLTKYGITSADYEAPFTAEMYRVAYANGLGFQKAIDDAKAAGQREIVIPNGNYPLCWAGGESEANPVIVSEGVDIYGNDSRLYIIFDEDGINPYFTGTNPHTLSGTVIATDSSVYDLTIEGERQYRVTSPGRKDQSCGIGLTGNSHNNVIQNCTIKHISGDGIGCQNLGVQLAHWTDPFTSLEWNGSAYVASKKMYRSGRHGVSFIPDMSAPHFINSTPNFMWSTEPFIIRCFNGGAADDLGDMIGVIRVHGMQYFYFPEGTTYWFIELTREAEHAEDATESWKFFMRQGYYSGTKVIGCELCYNQRGGMSNLPDSAVIRNCRVHNNGNPVNGMAAYYDSTRFGLDQEEVVIGSLTIEDSLFYGTNTGVFYKSFSIMLKNSKFYGDFTGVCSLNGAVDFTAINCDFVADHATYGGACILIGAAEFGEKTMIGCRVVGRISDTITVFGGDMSRAKPVTVLGADTFATSENYVWIGNNGKKPSAGLPEASEEDAGKFLRVQSDGSYILESLTDVSEVGA